MWQNKIQLLWKSIQNASPSATVFEKFEVTSGKQIKTSYADFMRDLNLLQREFDNLKNLKVLILMERSYTSFLTIVFCLLKGHCFIPVYSKSKRVLELINEIRPTHVWVDGSFTSPNGVQTTNVNDLLKKSVTSNETF
jgi:hypothetical protein